MNSRKNQERDKKNKEVWQWKDEKRTQYSKHDVMLYDMMDKYTI